MFEAFSDGYYIGRLYVAPADAPPRMHEAQVHHLNDELVDEDTGIVDLDRPLVMKLGSRHFPVHGDSEVPAGTLVVPDQLLDETPIENPPAVCGVLLATGERAEQLLWLSGQGGDVVT